MKGFFDILRRHERLVIGILSGTSVDAVDIVLVRFSEKNSETKPEVLDFRSYPIVKGLKQEILDASDPKTGTVADVCRLNVVIGLLFAKCIRRFLRANNLSPEDVSLIGSHGQTIHHLPSPERKFGVRYSSTLQIGDPSVIAGNTGITTVGDFRMGDIAAGGSGAPLVPYLDYMLFKSPRFDRILINIGGISNATVIPKNSEPEDVLAFDMGPGNMLIDDLSVRFLNRKFDKDGRTASGGVVNRSLLSEICRIDKFHKMKPPKSTGREVYGSGFSAKIIKLAGHIDLNDLFATVTEFTALAIAKNLNKFKADQILVSGGGAKNKFIMNSLKSKFGNAEVSVVDERGVNVQNKEAVLFAVLANELISGRKAGMKNITGSRKTSYLGKICPA